MVTDYRGKALFAAAVEPAVVTRLRALKVRRGYKIESMVNDALLRHLDALESLPVRPVAAPAAFKRAHKIKTRAVDSPFATLLK